MSARSPCFTLISPRVRSHYPGFGVALMWLWGGLRVALSSLCPGWPLRLPSEVLCRKLGHSWQDFLGAPNNPPGGQTFRPLSRSCTLHCRPLHFAYPARARSDFRSEEHTSEL